MPSGELHHQTMVSHTSSSPPPGNNDANDHHHEAGSPNAAAETPSKRAASVAAATSTEADTGAQASNDNDEYNSTINLEASPSKRPRISQGDDSEKDAGAGVAVASESAIESAIGTGGASGNAHTPPAPSSSHQPSFNKTHQSTTQQQHAVIDITSDAHTPTMPSSAKAMEVIDISSSEPIAKKLPFNDKQHSNNVNNNKSATVQIKMDPGAANNTTITMEEDSDSEVEILSPSRYPKNNRPGSSNTNNNDNVNGTAMKIDDDIEVTASNTTNANIEYAHMRHSCGLHPFVYGSDVHDYLNNNSKCCNKCYCFVCDGLASECKSWEVGASTTTGNGNGSVVGSYSAHCHAHDKDGKWVQLREATALKSRGGVTKKKAVDTGEVTLVNARNPYQRNDSQQQQQSGGAMSLIHNEFLSRLATGNDSTAVSVAEQTRQRVRERKDMRIHEVLLENFRRAVTLQEGNAAHQGESSASRAIVAKKQEAASTQTTTLHQKMEGDIPTISLYNSFFVEGIKIGWPFPEVMKPQRQMAIHLIRALKNKRHVVLESPTGTGKSAAILCSVLAWQRHHLKMEKLKLRQQSDGDGDSPMRIDEDGTNNEGRGKVQKVKIIYCSRTHSQVAQMVASLKSTPYRPRMAILGSRERLCIHKSIKPRGQGAEPVTGVNVNNECRLRVRNTEKSRKHHLTNVSSNDGPYNDDDPPEVMPGDGDGGGQEGGPTEDDDDNQGYIRRSRTCPHYRELSTSRVANLSHSTFVPNAKVDCCSVGGKKSKFGAHDIEDLVNFGVDPYLQKDIALYRREPNESFGLSLKGKRGCFVKEVKKDTPADVNGSIKTDDKILRVNGSDVSRSDPTTVVDKIKKTKSDPLLLDVSRGGSGSLSNGDGGYSSRAACPYYLSHVLSKDADILFAPYNYVLDPGIRAALGIELDNSVVILDEAHNVEGTLREAGSGKFGEFELCELLVMLSNSAMTERSTGNLIDVGGEAGLLSSESESQYLCDVAHTLLLFVEKVVNKLKTSRTCFQNNPGAKGAAKALKEWETYHTTDDHEFEVTFDGPTGKGQNGKCVGCLPFFQKLGLTKGDLDSLVTHVDAFEKFMRSRDGNDGSTERDRISNLLDRLMELIQKLNAAIHTPEHYYAAVLATANGSLDFANGGDGESEGGGRRSRKKKPRNLPLMPPRTSANPDRVPNPCPNPFCRAKCTDALNPIRHGKYCDGSTPKWECHLHLDLLTPGPLMQQLSNECRTVVLASGSLSPIPSLCAELNLFPADAPLSPVRSPQPNLTDALPKIQKRLQHQPPPLEADHVVNLEKQLFAVSIGHFPDGSELRVSQKNYKQADFLLKLGDALVKIVEGIREGGVLVFLPSYALLRKCERSWNPNGYGQNRGGWWAQNDEPDDGQSVWDRLKAAKHNIVVEPSGSQDEFEERKEEYMESVRTKGGCVLLAVYRGKMSEGISFNDNNARGVVCIGVPLPSAFALPIQVKMRYNDEQRKLRHRTDLLPGRDWYSQQAYRAIAQALGRCIRHAADYGAIFLLDIRHCDDGSPNQGIPQAHKNLPKWMRRAVKNLSKHSNGRSAMFNYAAASSSSISGGWPGLKTELQRFFRNAKPHVANVTKNQEEKIAKASNKNVIHTFNVQTNKWSAKKSTPPTTVPASSPCQSDESSNSTSVTPKQDCIAISSNTNASTSNSNSLFVKDKQPSKASQGSSKKKGGTLQEMFKKQQESGESQKSSLSSSSKSAKKTNNTPKTLKTMFEKQRADAFASPKMPAQEMIDLEEEEEEDTPEPAQASMPDPNPSISQPIVPINAAPVNSFSFKRSPFNDMLTPTTEVAASTSQLTLAQSQPATTAEEEHLCVVCEDAKKEVMLMPCNHMCLCKTCANRCLFKTIKECPMCRAKIEDSKEVFW